MAERDVFLQQADAVVGNPPYVRQEGMGKPNKERYLQVAMAGGTGQSFPDAAICMFISGRMPRAC